MNWICKDIAFLLKEAADPITYARLLPTAKVFGGQNENVFQRKKKLKEFLESMPKSFRPKKTRSSYFFWCMQRRPELKEENPDLNFRTLYQQIGQEWRNMSVEERAPYQAMVKKDQLRYRWELQQFRNGEWNNLMRRHQLARSALAMIDEEALLEAAKEIKSRIRKVANKQIWQNAPGLFYGTPSYRSRQQYIYKKHNVPKSGRSGYNFFMSAVNKQVRQELVKQQGEFSRIFNARVMREIGRRWRCLSDDEKIPYEKMAAEDKLKEARKIFGRD